MMKKRDYFWSFLPFLAIYISIKNYRYLWVFSSFFLIFGSLGYREKKGFRSLPRTQELSGGLFSLQMTSTSLHNNTHQPGVCSNRNQVSSWAGWKTVPSAQKAEQSRALLSKQVFLQGIVPHHVCHCELGHLYKVRHLLPALKSLLQLIPASENPVTVHYQPWSQDLCQNLCIIAQVNTLVQQFSLHPNQPF